MTRDEIQRKLFLRQANRAAEHLRKILGLPKRGSLPPQVDPVHHVCMEEFQVAEPPRRPLRPALVYADEEVPLLSAIADEKKIKPLLKKFHEAQEIYPVSSHVFVGVLWKQADRYFVLHAKFESPFRETPYVVFPKENLEIRSLQYFLGAWNLIFLPEE